MTKRTISAIALAAGMAFGTYAIAQNEAQTGQADQNRQESRTSDRDFHRDLQQANSPDKLFILTTAVGNECEIQMSQAAAEHSQSEQVKQLAQRMVQDHQKLAQQLQPIAQQQGVTIPQALPALEQQKLQVLSSLQGSDFDQAYLSDLKADHAANVSKFEDEAKLAKDNQLKQFAAQALPTLQEHQQMVSQAAVAVGLPSGMEAQPAGLRMHGEAGGANGNTGAEMNGNNSGTSGSGTAPGNGRAPQSGESGGIGGGAAGVQQPHSSSGAGSGTNDTGK